jgi:septal ring factor EnvC (AmiA/AmiB activator)
MRVPLGSPVRSVFPGRVAFADEYSDYGTTVILDHGDGYFTVSANLKVIDVRVGDDVGASSRIGSVGDTGEGSLLYFEIRRGTDTLNPAEWFGI